MSPRYISEKITVYVSAAPCATPHQPNNGWIQRRVYRHGQTIRYNCNNGYTLEGLATRKCINGLWSSNIPLCKGEISLFRFKFVLTGSLYSFDPFFIVFDNIFKLK